MEVPLIAIFSKRRYAVLKFIPKQKITLDTQKNVHWRSTMLHSVSPVCIETAAFKCEKVLLLLYPCFWGHRSKFLRYFSQFINKTLLLKSLEALCAMNRQYCHPPFRDILLRGSCIFNHNH
jgi:hypothetical protein